jgi:16S rRNA C967 or C1407 C5-methylase (RsmB/RsmF family)
MTPEETEGVVGAFEKLKPEEWEVNLPGDSQLQPELKSTILTDDKSYRIWPHYFNSDGFFGKAWRKL